MISKAHSVACSAEDVFVLRAFISYRRTMSHSVRLTREGRAIAPLVHEAGRLNTGLASTIHSMLGTNEDYVMFRIGPVLLDADRFISSIFSVDYSILVRKVHEAGARIGYVAEDGFHFSVEFRRSSAKKMVRLYYRYVNAFKELIAASMDDEIWDDWEPILQSLVRALDDIRCIE